MGRLSVCLGRSTERYYRLFGEMRANRSFIVQKRAMRIICNAKHNSHTDSLFKSCGILKLEDLYLQQSLLFVFDFLSNNLPVSFTDMFKFNRDMPDARITRHLSCYILTDANLNLQAHFLYIPFPLCGIDGYL